MTKPFSPGKLKFWEVARVVKIKNSRYRYISDCQHHEISDIDALEQLFWQKTFEWTAHLCIMLR